MNASDRPLAPAWLREGLTHQLVALHLIERAEMARVLEGCMAVHPGGGRLPCLMQDDSQENGFSAKSTHCVGWAYVRALSASHIHLVTPIPPHFIDRELESHALVLVLGPGWARWGREGNISLEDPVSSK